MQEKTSKLSLYNMKTIIAFTVGLIISICGFYALQPNAVDAPVEALSGFSDPFLSIQLSTTTATSGYVLSTDGINNLWIANTGGGGGGGSNWTPISGGLRTSTSTDFAQAAYFIATSTTGTSSFAGNVGIGTTTTTEALELGLNNRIKLSTSLDTASGDLNELIRLRYTTDDAKAAIAFLDKTGQSKVWVQAHDYLTYPTDRHRHFSIEVTDAGGSSKYTRLSIPYDQDVSEMQVNLSNLTLTNNSGFDSGKLYIQNDIFDSNSFQFFPYSSASSTGNRTYGLSLTIATTTTSTTTVLSALGDTKLYLNDNLIVLSNRIGIGTSSPQVALEVNQSDSNTTVTTGNAPAIRIVNTDTTNNNMGELSFTTNDTNGSALRTGTILGINTSHTVGSMTGVLAFLTRNSGTFAERMRLTGTGLGIGTTTPSRLLTVQGDGYFLNNITAASSTFTNSVSIGTTSTAFKLTATGTVGFYNLTAAAGTPDSICQNSATKEITVNAATSCVVSARDQKDDINVFDLSALDMVMRLKPSTFFYKDNLERERIGFIADELQAVDPRLGDAYKDGNARSIDIPALIALNTKAIQELYMKVDGKGAIAGAKRSVEENYQWILIALLLVWVVRLEIKTRI